MYLWKCLLFTPGLTSNVNYKQHWSVAKNGLVITSYTIFLARDDVD